MILGYEDFMILFAMLSPMYYIAYAHVKEIAKLKSRVYVCEQKCKEIEG